MGERPGPLRATREELAVFLRQAGLSYSPEHIDELYGALNRIAEMADRVRKFDAGPTAADFAITFKRPRTPP
jgi:hypothetical protein